MKKIFVLLLAVAVLVPTVALVGLAQPKCVPQCSENPKVMDREPIEAAAEFKGGQVQAGGLKPIELDPGQEVVFGLPQGTKTVTITAGEGDLTYILTKIVGTGTRATRTKVAEGVVAAKQSVTVNVPAFDRAKQESVEIAVTAADKKTSVTLVFQGAPADETVLPRVAVELEIANQGPADINYEVKDALNRTVKNAGRDVKGAVKAGEKAVVGIEESLGPNRILQISTKGDAKVDIKIFYEQIPQAAEIGRGIYSEVMIARPRTLNPIIANDSASITVIARVFDTLLDGGLINPEDAMAEAFEVSPDRKTVTYTLRKGLKFNDGTPVTAEDVRFTFFLAFHPDVTTFGRDSYFCKGGKDLPKVEVVDERRIRFSCPEPATYTPHPAVGTMDILSKRKILQLAPNVERDPRSFNAVYGVNTKPEDLVGAGPFKLSKIDPNTVVEFVRNPYTFRVDEKGNQLPYIAGIRILLAPTQGQELALQQFRNGQTDFLGPRPADIAILQSDKAAGRLPVNDDIDTGVAINQVDYMWFSWTTQNPTLRAAFANKQVRFVFSHALDRAGYVRNIMLGLGSEQYSQYSLTNPFHIERPGQKAEVLARWEQAKKRFDLKKAAEILDSLGIKDTNNDGVREIPANFANDFGPQTNPAGPFKFTLNTNVGNTRREEIIKVFASDLKKIGIEVNPVAIDFAAMIDQLTIGDYEGILVGLGGAGPFASAGINVWTCGGELHSWNVKAGDDCSGATKEERELHNLYRQMSEESDRAKLHELADRAQFLFAEFLPIVPIAIPNSLQAYRTDTIRNHARAPLANSLVLFCKGGRCRGG
ncbi:MAG: ABC transporter substrate-binding protein [Candidatus Bipolaricaulota bacterium]|nr:ABC transporter substrate-binding protein [Candidatus Bipolaricaulota bacterium]